MIFLYESDEKGVYSSYRSNKSSYFRRYYYACGSFFFVLVNVIGLTRVPHSWGGTRDKPKSICVARGRLPRLSLVFICRENPRRSIGDFTFFRASRILPIYQICARGLSQVFPIMSYLFVIRGLRGLVMSEILRRRMPMCPGRYKYEFSFVGNDRRPLQKSATRRENRNAPDSPDLSPLIPDDRGYLRLVGKIWDGRETVKSQTVFPTYENQALI